MSTQEYASKSDAAQMNSSTRQSGAADPETGSDAGVTEKPLVFISYSHQDEVWKDRLYSHLRALELIGKITVWNDRDIGAGDVWNENIQQAMEQAQVAICLISPDFLASGFCVTKEIPRLLERHRNGELKIIPVLLRPCSWDKRPWLEQLQMLPRDGKTVAVDFREDYDGVFKQVAEYILAEEDELPPPAPFEPWWNKLLYWIRSNPVPAATGFAVSVIAVLLLSRILVPAPPPPYILELMETAEAHTEMQRTCQPAGSSAWDAYQTILQTHPQYQPAIKALERLNCTDRM